MVINPERIFKINQRLEIRLSRNPNDQQYTSRIEEFIHDYMVIAMPMKKGCPIFSTKGHEFYGKMFDEGGAYSFKSKFVDKKMSSLPIWIVTMPFDVVKTQKRSFVRCDVLLPVVLEYPANHEEDEIISIKAMTRDLSAGGLQVICEQKIKLGKQLNVLLKLPDHELFKIEGEVVRISKPQDDRDLYWISIQFLTIHETMRDKISKFIFRKQVEQRQKRL